MNGMEKGRKEKGGKRKEKEQKQGKRGTTRAHARARMWSRKFPGSRVNTLEFLRANIYLPRAEGRLSPSTFGGGRDGGSRAVANFAVKT